MRFKRGLLFLAVMGLAHLLFTLPAHPTELEMQRETLRGLTGLYVYVDILGNTKDLFDIDAIRVDAELKLRMAGIKVLSTKEIKPPGTPYLLVRLIIRRTPDLPSFYYSANVWLVQSVYLERNPSIHLSGLTWVVSRLGYVGEEHLSMIRDRIKDQIDIFINDYLSVNPKGGK